MATSYGTTTTYTGGRGVRASADGRPRYKAGGITLDWSVVTAVSGSDATLADGRVVKIGDKYIPFGRVLNRIQGSAVHVVTVDATSGNFTLTVAVNGAAGQTTANIAENAAAATVQSALEALSNVAPGDVVVTGSAGGPFTLTWGGALANASVVVTAADVDLAGGGDTVSVATSAQGSVNTGKWGPFDSAAVDGRQTATAVVRGDSFILDETVVMSDLHSDHPPVFDGGRVFKSRVVGISGNPTEAQIEAMFPDVTFVND